MVAEQLLCWVELDDAGKDLRKQVCACWLAGLVCPRLHV